MLIVRRLAIAAVALVLTAQAAAGSASDKRTDPLEAARAALRTLQYDKALHALEPLSRADNPNAQYLLGMMYLNGVGVAPDAPKARGLLESAATHGSGAAAYALAGELARDPSADPQASAQWLQRSAALHYERAADVLKTNRGLLAPEPLYTDDQALLAAWAIDCARRNDAAALRSLGKPAAQVQDEFGRDALMHAVATASQDAATVLLESGADPRHADKYGTTALMLAVQLADTRLAQLLVQHGAAVSAADSEHRTALFYAARSNRPGGIELLQPAGEALTLLDSHGYNALDVAVAAHAEAAAARLKELGARPTVVASVQARSTGKFDAAHPGEIYSGWQPLALAVARDDATSLQQLLTAGGDAQLRLPQGEGLLQLAVDARALDCFAPLLKHGADPKAVNQAGHSVLWQAATNDEPPVLQALIAAGVPADTHGEHEETPLIAATRARHAENIRVLLDAGANLESADADGRTPLMIAAASGDAALLHALLARHANVSAQDHAGRQALWYAAWSGTAECVRALLTAGAEINAADHQGLAALQAAASHGQPGTVEALIEAHARVSAHAQNGSTALILAAASGHESAVTALLAASAVLDQQNQAGDTALIAASRGGYTDICHALLRAGANRALRNASQVSAADVAKGRGFALLAKDLAGKT
jgi:ankyrin repeat protein